MATDMEIIDDQYWLAYAKSSVEKSLSSRNEAAAKLEKMTLWFWGLYTASFTIGVTINAINAPYWVLILLASPIVFLIITYWFCVLAQFPVTSGYDPKIPYEIKQGYNQGLKKKNARFNWALSFTFVSAILLSSALFSLAFVDKKNTTVITSRFDKEKSAIIISGLLPKNVTATTTIDTLSCDKSKAPIYLNQYTVQENGILNLNIPVKPMPKKAIVTVTWTEDGKQKGLAQLVAQ